MKQSAHTLLYYAVTIKLQFINLDCSDCREMINDGDGGNCRTTSAVDEAIDPQFGRRWRLKEEKKKERGREGEMGVEERLGGGGVWRTSEGEG